MRIGIIGVGNICKKAYLPSLTAMEDVEIIICTRNDETRKEVSNKYRISTTVSTIDELLDKNIDCAFVHSSTESHYSICKKLLENNIATYVDKPLSYNLAESEELVTLAKEKGTLLKVGFNRRYAPMITSLSKEEEANIIILQKNRAASALDKRIFIYDDFIHTLDTALFLLKGKVTDLTVNFKATDNNSLSNVVVKLSNVKTTAIALMDRENGINEENIEYMTNNKKIVIKNLTEKTIYHNSNTAIEGFSDWDTTLYKRGFEDIVKDFLSKVKNDSLDDEGLENALNSHIICEKIIELIN